MSPRTSRFCSSCGGPLVERLVQAEQRSRLVCQNCGAICYRNPKVLVSTIVTAGDRVLLCRRAQPPAAGRWSLPGGFMECSETFEEAAARETFEETGLRIEPRSLRLHALSTLSHIGEIYVGFLAAVPNESEPVCGPECLDVRFFTESTVPWKELAYADIGVYIQTFFSEKRNARHIFHFGRIDSTSVATSTYEILSIQERRRPRATSEGSESD